MKTALLEITIEMLAAEFDYSLNSSRSNNTKRNFIDQFWKLFIRVTEIDVCSVCAHTRSVYICDSSSNYQRQL